MYTAKFLQGGGQTGELIRNTDWAAGPLGEPDTWPDSLKFALSIALNSGLPIAIYWGTDFKMFYNDAYSRILGSKHPQALAKPAETVLFEVWEKLEPDFKRVLTNGESVRADHASLPMLRFGYLEECYFDYTLSPIVTADGDVAGIFNSVIETSYRMIAERRIQVLHALTELQTTPYLVPGIEEEMAVLASA
ncbi:MAG: two-component system sensor histidine kinase/response regulator, partial [Sphingobacteriaceae bacterium]